MLERLIHYIVWAVDAARDDFPGPGRPDAKVKAHAEWAVQALAEDLNACIPSDPLQTRPETAGDLRLLDELMDGAAVLGALTQDQYLQALGWLVDKASTDANPLAELYEPAPFCPDILQLAEPAEPKMIAASVTEEPPIIEVEAEAEPVGEVEPEPEPLPIPLPQRGVPKRKPRYHWARLQLRVVNTKTDVHGKVIGARNDFTLAIETDSGGLDDWLFSDTTIERGEPPAPVPADELQAYRAKCSARRQRRFQKRRAQAV